MLKNGVNVVLQNLDSPVPNGVRVIPATVVSIDGNIMVLQIDGEISELKIAESFSTSYPYVG